MAVTMQVLLPSLADLVASVAQNDLRGAALLRAVSARVRPIAH